MTEQEFFKLSPDALLLITKPKEEESAPYWIDGMNKYAGRKVLKGRFWRVMFTCVAGSVPCSMLETFYFQFEWLSVIPQKRIKVKRMARL